MTNRVYLDWNATAPLAKIPFERIQALVQEKYSERDWIGSG